MQFALQKLLETSRMTILGIGARCVPRYLCGALARIALFDRAAGPKKTAGQTMSPHSLYHHLGKHNFFNIKLFLFEKRLEQILSVFSWTIHGIESTISEKP